MIGLSGCGGIFTDSVLTALNDGCQVSFVDNFMVNFWSILGTILWKTLGQFQDNFLRQYLSVAQSKAKLLQLKLIHIFARAILLMKKLEIEKTKPTYIISVLKVVYWVALVSSIFNIFINKIALTNKWMRKIIPSCINFALECF